MSKKNKSSIADQMDNHKRLMALAILLLSIIYGIKTTFYFVDSETKHYLVLIATGLFILVAIILIILVSWRFITMARKKGCLQPPSDSFVMHVRNKAIITSWILTFVFVSVLTVITNRNSSPLPAEFYLNFISFIMLAVFGVSFFILFRAGSDDEDEQGVIE